MNVKFSQGALDPESQAQVSAGFERHSQQGNAPEYQKQQVNWQVTDDKGQLVGVLTAETLWGWIYIDELWVDETYRGSGLGRQLMQKAEEYAISQKLTGLWLWTQSWQAPKFYQRLGYVEFTRFDDFPKGHSRIGLRKQL